MLTKKRIVLIILMIALLILIPNIVKASEKIETTKDGIQWEYELNESNQIINLICKDVSSLSGSITVPNTLDGKEVNSIGGGAFEGANITEITISNGIKDIEHGAFDGCKNLVNVDLGNTEYLAWDVFKNCISLKEITIPKTLNKGNSIGTAFKGCTSLTKITLEDGLTNIGSHLCEGTNITEITIPDSVKSIDYSAFENCTKLEKVNLGKIESISFNVFKGCTNLKSITIPKTLKDGSVSPCLNNPNITSITFEEGLTVIPTCLCANTGITEITIPDSVKSIDYSAFENCTNLKKITILDNVKDMGFYNISDKDSIFQNHDKDLTIYCYENSMAAKYAIKYNIKYVYLTKPAKTNEEPAKQEEPAKKDDNAKVTNNQSQVADKSSQEVNKEKETADSSKATGPLPYTGPETIIVLSIIIFAVIGIYLYIKNKDLRGI